MCIHILQSGLRNVLCYLNLNMGTSNVLGIHFQPTNDNCWGDEVQEECWQGHKGFCPDAAEFCFVSMPWFIYQTNEANINMSKLLLLQLSLEEHSIYFRFRGLASIQDSWRIAVKCKRKRPTKQVISQKSTICRGGRG